jgi:hypothetical protein
VNVVRGTVGETLSWLLEARLPIAGATVVTADLRGPRGVRRGVSITIDVPARRFTYTVGTRELDVEGDYSLEVVYLSGGLNRRTGLSFKVWRQQDVSVSGGGSGAVQTAGLQHTFLWTVTNTNNEWTVTLPAAFEPGSTNYAVHVSFVDPVGAVSTWWTPSALKTLTQFVLRSTDQLQLGATLHFTIHVIGT